MDNEKKEMTTPVVPPSPPLLAEPHSTSGTDWNSLPYVMEEKIIGKLELEPLKEVKKTLLKCKQVNTTWKQIAHSVIDRLTLAEWTKWEPTEPEKSDPLDYWDDWEEDVDEYEVPNCHIWKHAGELGAFQFRPIWSYFEEHSNSSNPIPNFEQEDFLPKVNNPRMGTRFPNNFVRIRFHDKIWPDRNRFVMSRRVGMLKDFLLKYHYCFCHLSTLLLTYIQFTPTDMKTILGYLGKLKALTLENTLLLSDESTPEEENPSLPPLPVLKYLRVTSSTGDANLLLLTAYYLQLTSLETNQLVPIFSTSYKELKMLKIMTNNKPDLQFPPLEGGGSPFPALESLSVIIHKGHLFTWEELSKSIDTLPKTLIRLHLDVKIKRNTEEEEEDEILQLRSSGVTFPSLKSLRIFLPGSGKHAELLRQVFFPKFPELEFLTMDKCFYVRNDHSGFAIYEFQYVSMLVKEFQFWSQVCPRLRKVDII